MSTTTPPAPSPRSRSATWKPFMSGSWMSSRTTSGRRARTAWIAAAPSAASPTTPKPSACNTARARPRKPGWSSTISTVRMTAASSHPPGPRSSVPPLRQLRWPPGWRAGAVPVRSPHHQQGSPQWVLRRKEAVMTAATDNLDARTPPTRASLSPVSAPAADLVAYVGAAAFVMAAVWYGLTARFITLAKPPAFNPNAPLDAELHRWFNWFVTTLPQERLDTGIAIIGFLCLVPLAAFARDLLGRDRVLARVGSAAMPAGALLWVAGNVLRLGGHQAAGLMATHHNPVGTVNAILFTVDTIADAFELAAFAVLGVALLTFAVAGVAGAADRDLIDPLLVTGGALLLPVWLVWTGRLLRTARASQTRNRA